jgi:hypothetical protein
MKTSNPPWLAVALLQHAAGSNEPLVGDLLEQFAVRRSRFWFWRQVLFAIVVSLRRRDVNNRPLHLTDEAWGLYADGTRTRTQPKRINLSASPLPDVGGLGLVVLLMIVTMVRPEALWLVLSAVLGGGVLGIVLVLVRRRRVVTRPASGRVSMLPGPDDVHQTRES